MALTCTLNNCPQPIHDNATLCRGCTTTLRGDLQFLAHGWRQLQLTITRQDALLPGQGHSDARLDYNDPASDAARAVSNTLTTWTRAVADELHLDPPGLDRPHGPTCPTCDHPTCAGIRVVALAQRQTVEVRCATWLLRHVDRARRHDIGTELADEIGYARQLTERTIDRPADKQYLAQCDICGTDLYAKPDADSTECRACSMVYDVNQRRQSILAKADHHLGTATEAARALTSLGDPVTPERIRQWASRGRLLARGRNHRGHPTYRIGEIRDLLHDEHRRANAG